MSIFEALAGALAFVVGLVSFLGTIVLADWAVHEPRKRWWGFLPLLIFVWLVCGGYAYISSHVSGT